MTGKLQHCHSNAMMPVAESYKESDKYELPKIKKQNVKKSRQLDKTFMQVCCIYDC